MRLKERIRWLFRGWLPNGKYAVKVRSQSLIPAILVSILTGSLAAASAWHFSSMQAGATISTLQTEVNQLQTELGSSLSLAETLEREKEALESQLADGLAEIEDLSRQNEMLQTHIDQLSQEVRWLRERLNSPNSSKEIYVPDDYSAIQSAIENADAGWAIIVRDGIYNENIKVDKSLTIKSAGGPEHCVVVAASEDCVFEITANNVTIKGFTIKDALISNPGIHILGNNCIIENNILYNNDPNILMSCSHSNLIVNNTVTNVQYDYSGIRLDQSNSNTIIGNTVHWNSFGIDLVFSENNKIIGNRVDKSLFGIELATYSNSNLVLENVVFSNWEGIFLGPEMCCAEPGCFYNVVANNTLFNNYDGILLQASNHNSIMNNLLTNNTNGMALDSSDNNTLEANMLNNDEIRLHLSSYNVISRNTASWSESIHGCIHLDCSNSNIITRNQVLDNNLGVFIYSSYENTIFLNSFMNSRNYHSFASNNSWHSTSEFTYAFGGDTYSGFLGNHWSDYEGSDMNGNLVGDHPYRILASDEPLESSYPWRPNGYPWLPYEYEDADSFPLIVRSDLLQVPENV